MPQVNVSIAGRVYRMACGEGEEDHLVGLARRLDGRIGSLRGQFGEIGDQRITVMAAITIMDELGEAERRIAVLQGDIAALQEHDRSQERRIVAMTETVAAVLDGVTAEIDEVARALPASPRPGA